MNALSLYDTVWNRCDLLTALHAYLESNTSSVLQPDELLRAEWVARVSALDLYVHELVSQRMLEIFEGLRSPTDSFNRFTVDTDSMNRIRQASAAQDASAAFDLCIRTTLSRKTFQFPEDIADGIRLCSDVELWNTLAFKRGASQSNKSQIAKSLKTDLSLIVGRRNSIAHEGDLQKAIPREPWPITKNDLVVVKTTLDWLVREIDNIV